jgi:hypothetical protein
VLPLRKKTQKLYQPTRTLHLSDGTSPPLGGPECLSTRTPPNPRGGWGGGGGRRGLYISPPSLSEGLQGGRLLKVE